MVTDEECVGLVKGWTEGEGGEGQRGDVARRLVEEAVGRGSTDNVSVVVAWI